MLLEKMGVLVGQSGKMNSFSYLDDSGKWFSEQSTARENNIY